MPPKLVLPGFSGCAVKGVTGGNPELIETIARAGIAIGCNGIFLETHPNLKIAKSLDHRSLDENSPKYREFAEKLSQRIAAQQKKVKHKIFF